MCRVPLEVDRSTRASPVSLGVLHAGRRLPLLRVPRCRPCLVRRGRVELEAQPRGEGLRGGPTSRPDALAAVAHLRRRCRRPHVPGGDGTTWTFPHSGHLARRPAYSSAALKARPQSHWNPIAIIPPMSLMNPMWMGREWARSRAPAPVFASGDPPPLGPGPVQEVAEVAAYGEEPKASKTMALTCWSVSLVSFIRSMSSLQLARPLQVRVDGRRHDLGQVEAARNASASGPPCRVAAERHFAAHEDAGPRHGRDRHRLVVAAAQADGHRVVRLVTVGHNEVHDPEELRVAPPAVVYSSRVIQIACGLQPLRD